MSLEDLPASPNTVDADMPTPPAPVWRAAHVEREHVVHFYEDDAALVAALGAVLGDGLAADDLVVVIAADSHLEALIRRLEARGLDVAGARSSGQLTLLDAQATLDRFMRKGAPDPGLFELEVGALIERRLATAGPRKLRAYGEMVDLLWSQGNRPAAIQLEELWNALQERHPFTLRCAYAMGGFHGHASGLNEVFAAHTRVVDRLPESRPGENPASAAAAPATTVPAAQARLLAHEIEHRQQVEVVLRDSLRELRHSQDELRASEEQLRDFVENANVGLHRVGADGTILWANRAELELLGYTADEYIGRPIADFHVDREVIADILARLGRGEALHDRAARLVARDGSMKHVVISSSPLMRDGQLVHTRCFTRDVTRRHEAEEARRQSERQLRSVTDALPGLVCFIDPERRYRFVNAAYERWFGRGQEEILGQQVEDIVGPAAYRQIAGALDRAFAGETVTYEAESVYLDGQARWIHATCTPQLDHDGRVVGCVNLIVDISERKAFERQRSRAARWNERLVKITAALADAVERSEVFEAVVDHVCEAVEGSSAALWIIDPDGRSMHLARAAGYLEASRKSFETLPLDGSVRVPATDAASRREPIWIGSQAALVRAYPQVRTAVTTGRDYRVACLPLVSQARTLGVLGLTLEEAREPDEEERRFLLLIARYAGQALERLRLFDAERLSRQEADAAAARLGLLGRVSRAFVEAKLDLRERLRDIVRELGGALASSGVGISLIGADGYLHTVAVHHPLPEAEAELVRLAAAAPVALGEGVSGGVARSGRSVLLSAIDTTALVQRAASGYLDFVARHPVHAMICVPLRARDRIIGTVLATRGAGETYGAGDLELLEELAERAAAAIENSRLHEENLAARRRAEELYRFAQCTVSADSADKAFEAALDAILASLRTERAAILLFDSAGVMRFRAARGLSEAYQRAVEGHSPWARDVVDPEPVLVPDVEREPSLSSYLPLLHEERIRSLAFIPLISGGRLIGKFMAYHGEAHVYSAGELELAVAIAHHLASVTSRFAAVGKLEETIRHNELFAGVLAHDLRNPLGAIMTAAQVVLMRAEGSGDATSKPLSRILSSGQRMARMIEQLLDFTRARVGGGIQVQVRSSNLADLCRQAIEELELANPAWRIRFEASGALDGVWDPERFLQVVSNLIANAGQHGNPDSVITVDLDGRQADAVVLRIHNRGVIPPALQASLFDPFRSTHHRADHARGLGLGLFIVKDIVRAHGGAIDVTSSDEQGTTFVIRLPRIAAVASPSRAY